MASDTIKVKYLSTYDSWKYVGGGISSGYADTKQEAIDRAKSLAKRRGKRVEIQKQSGAVQKTLDYR